MLRIEPFRAEDSRRNSQMKVPTDLPHSGGINFFHEQPKPSRILTTVVRRIFSSPASTFCRFLVLIWTRSANSSWVKPLAYRSRRTFAPNNLSLICSFRLKGTVHYAVASDGNGTSQYIVNHFLLSETWEAKSCSGGVLNADFGLIKDFQRKALQNSETGLKTRRLCFRRRDRCRPLDEILLGVRCLVESPPGATVRPAILVEEARMRDKGNTGKGAKGHRGHLASTELLAAAKLL